MFNIHQGGRGGWKVSGKDWGCEQHAWPAHVQRWQRGGCWIHAFLIAFCRLPKPRIGSTNFWRPRAKWRQTKLRGRRLIKVKQWKLLHLLLQFTAGCRTVENRSVINTTEVQEEKRKKEATRLKELGNQVFHIWRHQNYSLDHSSGIQKRGAWCGWGVLHKRFDAVKLQFLTT